MGHKDSREVGACLACSKLGLNPHHSFHDPPSPVRSDLGAETEVLSTSVSLAKQIWIRITIRICGK